METYDVVIVGAGHGGCATATQLRALGYDGTILLIGEETVLPYQRPPLSKERLKTTAELGSLELRPSAVYSDERIELRLGSRVESVAPDKRSLDLADGSRVGWRRLVLATGAAPMVPAVPGARHSSVHVLRDVDDADRLAAAIGPRRRLVVVGGGYLGLEVAASARGMKADVTVLEARGQVLARVASDEIATFLTEHHRSQGVCIRTNAGVEAFETTGAGRPTVVRMADGTHLECDAVLLAVGASPRDALARRAGLTCQGGIPVDIRGATGVPDVFAVGDATVRPVPQYGLQMRLESIQSVNEQARHVAAAIAGKPARPHETPWFWSDQYDLKIQIAGLRTDADTVVVRGERHQPGFAVFHLRGEQLRAVEAVNAPREFALGRKFIGEGTHVSARALADPETPLRDVVLGTGR
ncbi:NAD(P)/FAD-dependent oxidoreductase [Streptomyces sp. NPDC048438]|uniref:NAD(P)/FAD-dependent oxidoreductase n=1 Tax=Streptomyces sp. NPDC048438 TaxID=3365551 RepID=UPI00371D8BDA